MQQKIEAGKAGTTHFITTKCLKHFDVSGLNSCTQRVDFLAMRVVFSIPLKDQTTKLPRPLAFCEMAHGWKKGGSAFPSQGISIGNIFAYLARQFCMCVRTLKKLYYYTQNTLLNKKINSKGMKILYISRNRKWFWDWIENELSWFYLHL